MSDPRDSILELSRQARTLQAASRDKAVHRLLEKAIQHFTGALGMHNIADSNPFHSMDGANAHVTEGRDLLNRAAFKHSKKLESGEEPSSTVLDLKYLGKGQELHDTYADAVTEGKNKNGR